VAFAQLDYGTFVTDDGADDAHAALRSLYRDTAPWLRTTLTRLTWPAAPVDDFLHDVFIVALRRRAELLRADSGRAWLYGITVKVASDKRRRHALWSFVGLDAAGLPAAASRPHDDLERAQAEALLHRGLSQLSAVKREVFVLFELDGLTGPEIAQALGVPLTTVWNRLHHARRELLEITREWVAPEQES
jgi:RNA polymerase sigma-70 factor (ECF subfamily)